MFYDTHAHLNDPRLMENSDALVENAKVNQVFLINNVGYDLQSSLDAVALAKKYPNNYAIIGIHPHDADQWNEESEKIFRELLDHKVENKIVAIGEIGLDYHFEDRLSDEIQKRAFQAQMKLAFEYSLPVSIHSRDAGEDTLAILEHLQAEGNLLSERPGVFHCFSYSTDFVDRSRKFAFYYGFDGPVTFKNAQDKVELVEYLNLDEILIETDCPYMAPVPYRGRDNQPAYVVEVARKIADLKNSTLEEVANITSANGKYLFGVDVLEEEN